MGGTRDRAEEADGADAPETVPDPRGRVGVCQEALRLPAPGGRRPTMMMAMALPVAPARDSCRSHCWERPRSGPWEALVPCGLVQRCRNRGWVEVAGAGPRGRCDRAARSENALLGLVVSVGKGANTQGRSRVTRHGNAIVDFLRRPVLARSFCRVHLACGKLTVLSVSAMDVSNCSLVQGGKGAISFPRGCQWQKRPSDRCAWSRQSRQSRQSRPCALEKNHSRDNRNVRWLQQGYRFGAAARPLEALTAPPGQFGIVCVCVRLRVCVCVQQKCVGIACLVCLWGCWRARGKCSWSAVPAAEDGRATRVRPIGGFGVRQLQLSLFLLTGFSDVVRQMRDHSSPQAGERTQ